MYRRSLFLTLRRYSSGDSASQRIYKFFKGTPKEASISEYEKQLESEEALRQSIEDEKRAADFKRLRNVSKLSASHQREISGKHPLVGTVYPMESHHKSKDFRMKMFGIYGESTGIDPSTCWPTPEQLHDQQEFEAVFYDRKDLLTIIREEDEKQKQVEEAAKAREETIRTNIKEMDKALHDWKNKIKMRNQMAEEQRLRRLTILKELRQEYGYEIDPNIPSHAEKIAQKETEYLQKEREAKKAKRKAKMQASK